MSSGSSFMLVAAMVTAVAAPASAEHRHTWLYVNLDRPKPAPEQTTVLRVCADPNNLPFSNRAGEGFENAIARLAAASLRRRLEYYWLPQRRGFVRNSLKAGLCDAVIGVQASSDMTKNTRAYYRSSYMFLARAGLPAITSLDDPRLAHLRVGVQVIGDDYQNAPPAQALANRGIVSQVRGFPVYGDYASDLPLRSIVDAVAARQIDVAIVWGPIAGYLASRTRTPLVLTPVSPQIDLPYLPFVFDIAMGVRHDDPDLAAALDGVIASHPEEIAAILDRFHVPVLPREEVATR